MSFHGRERGFWGGLLSWLTEGRWSSAGLLIADLLGDDASSGSGFGCERPSEPLERAWLLAQKVAEGPDSTLGRFCTPRPVALELAALTLREDDRAVYDPACGAGALALAGIEILQTRGLEPKWDSFGGADVDPFCTAMAQASLWIAAGCPEVLPGQFLSADFLVRGLPELTSETAVLANPPWGVKVSSAQRSSWSQRAGSEIAAELRGETNIYELFLAELALRSGIQVGLITPIHWLHRRSLDGMRLSLASSGRLSEVVLLKKGTFPNARDMIPILSAWSDRPPSDSIRVRRVDLSTSAPLTSPMTFVSDLSLSEDDWRSTPFSVFPVLRTPVLAPLATQFFAAACKFCDTRKPRSERLFDAGDGIYKSRLKDWLTTSATGWPVLTQASSTRRYGLDEARVWLRSGTESRLSTRDTARFKGPMLILHALKKANAPWRLSASLWPGVRPLALSNNFLVLSAKRYNGDLYYPLALLNSRLFNAMYTECFPGVNIEAYTVGSLPLPWPPEPDDSPPPHEGWDRRSLLAWSLGAVSEEGTIRNSVYLWLARKTKDLCELAGQDQEAFDKLDRRIEAVIVGAFGGDLRVLEAISSRSGT